MDGTANRKNRTIIILFCAVVVFAAVSLFIGRYPLSIAGVLSGEASNIVVNVRTPEDHNVCAPRERSFSSRCKLSGDI